MSRNLVGLVMLAVLALAVAVPAEAGQLQSEALECQWGGSIEATCTATYDDQEVCVPGARPAICVGTE